MPVIASVPTYRAPVTAWVHKNRYKGMDPRINQAEGALIMRTAIDLGGSFESSRAGIQIIRRTTSVECEKDVRCWRSLRSLVEFVLPACCACTASVDDDDDGVSTTTATTTLGSTVTGTIFGQRKGRVSFCIQEDSRGPPLVLLEFALPTHSLAKEMQHGLLRITLECYKHRSDGAPSLSLFAVPVWTMYCNGRRAGFAVRRQPTERDRAILKLVQSVSAGAGVIPRRSGNAETEQGRGGEVMYMRATYERVVGSPDSESFHLINPVGSTGQQLSIFFLRS